MGRGQGDHVGTGSPLSFMCRRARLNKWRAELHGYNPYLGHEEVIRTGRVRSRRSRGQMRVLNEVHEYRCECGYVGWTNHTDILRKPLAE